MNEADVWLYTEPAGDCLIWTRGHTTHGYGKINLGGYRYDLAHRAAYRQAHGPIPRGMVVMHTCDNPPCVKPEHLQLGTYRDNALDMVQKGRARPGEPKRGADWIPPRFTPDRVAELRAEFASADMTYADLAAREGVARVTIARLISGRSYPDNVKRARAR